MNSVGSALICKTLTLLLCAVLLNASPLDAAGQGEFAFPMTPDRDHCLSESVRLERLAELAATPAASPRAIDPSGAPVIGDADRDDIVATIVGVFACLNAGEPLHAYALYSDTYLNQIMPQDGIERLATPYAIADDEATVIVDVRDVRLLEDGRVYATVVLDPALIPVEKIYGFVLVQVREQWLVDDVLDELRFELP